MGRGFGSAFLCSVHSAAINALLREIDCCLASEGIDRGYDDHMLAWRDSDFDWLSVKATYRCAPTIRFLLDCFDAVGFVVNEHEQGFGPTSKIEAAKEGTRN